MYDYVIIAGDFNVDFAKVNLNCAILEYFGTKEWANAEVLQKGC